MRILAVLLVVVALAGCAGTDEAIDASGSVHSEVTAASLAERPTGETSDTAHPVSRLVEFRDAAAGAPFWATVDWTPPATITDVTHSRDEVMRGTLVEAVLPDAPRADELEPYEGAPTLFHVEVLLGVVEEGGGNHTVRVPVGSSGAQGLGFGDESARRITSLAPVGADVLLVSGEHGASIVAMEADDGSLVGYYSSLDDLAGSHTLGSLRAAIEAELSG